MNGLVSFIVVSAMTAFWVVFFARAFLKSVSHKKRDDRRHSGRMVSGKIIKSAKSGLGKFSTTNIIIEYTNLSNSKIQDTFSFRDTKPEQNRYEEGKTVQLILDDRAKLGEKIKLSGAKKKGSNFIAFILFCLSGGSAYLLYTIYTLTDQQLGGDWSRIDHLKSMEGLAIMSSVFVFTLLLIHFIFKATKLMGSKDSKDFNEQLKLFGYRATAKITEVTETGTRVNEKPVIRFHYEFEDEYGTVHKGKDQMIMGMLEISGIQNLGEKEILYLKDDPSQNKMMESLKGNMLGGCLNLTLLFMGLIFTIVCISMYLASV